MKVKVKEGEKVFYVDKLFTEGQEFEITEREHSVDKDSKGKPVVITEEQQFSEKTMIRLDKPKAGRKPKVVEQEANDD